MKRHNECPKIIFDNVGEGRSYGLMM
jgi:hypothetical protein